MSTQQPGVIQISRTFVKQSYLGELAHETLPYSQTILEQNSNGGGAVRDFSGPSGYSVTLSPSSKVPLAVTFSMESGKNIGPLLLTPGQRIAPGGKFSNFRYGLPFGWLGGGIANVFVCENESAKVDFSGLPSELLFHRFSTAILGPVTTPPQYKNWPTTFPWKESLKFIPGGTAQAQEGNPFITLRETTKVLMRLNEPSALGANACSVVFWGIDDFGPKDLIVDNKEVVSPVLNSDQFFYDIYWPDNSNIAAGSRSPIISLPVEIAGLSSNSWGISIHAPAGSPLIGKQVDVTRYGRL